MTEVTPRLFCFLALENTPVSLRTHMSEDVGYSWEDTFLEFLHRILVAPEFTLLLVAKTRSGMIAIKRRSAWLAVSVLLAAIPTTASAAFNGATACKSGERVVSRFTEVYIPGYIDNAQRGDVLLTSGGGGVPREIFRALNKTYNHTMLISQGDDGHGNTLITHDTAIAPGLHSLEFNVSVGFGLQIDARWKPSHLRRMIPGNVVADKASTLIHGKKTGCLSASHGIGGGNTAPNTFNDCLDARPINLWSNANLLLRPAAPYLQQGDIITQAEAVPQHHYLYAFGAYSNHLGVYNATGNESAYGPGTMCSGFATEAVNDALALRGYSAQNVNPVFYNNAERFTAAIALHNRLHEDLMEVFSAVTNGPWYARALAALLNFNANATATALANQIVNCFAHGGVCDDVSSWTTVDPVAFKLVTPTPATGSYYTPATNSLGTGSSLAGDDLLADAVNKGWATPVSAMLLGDYYYDKFSHIECCQVDPVTDQVTGNCYRPSLFPDEVAVVEGFVRKEVLQAGGGDFVETKDSYCYTNEKGSVCTKLPPEEPAVPADDKDDRGDGGSAEEADPTVEEAASQSETMAALSGAENEEVAR